MLDTCARQQLCAQRLHPPPVVTPRYSRGPRSSRVVCFSAPDDAAQSTASRRSALMALTAAAGATASLTWASYAVSISSGQRQTRLILPSSSIVNPLPCPCCMCRQQAPIPADQGHPLPQQQPPQQRPMLSVGLLNLWTCRGCSTHACPASQHVWGTSASSTSMSLTPRWVPRQLSGAP
jgi:hypothetical protein